MLQLARMVSLQREEETKVLNNFLEINGNAALSLDCHVSSGHERARALPKCTMKPFISLLLEQGKAVGIIRALSRTSHKTPIYSLNKELLLAKGAILLYIPTLTSQNRQDGSTV